MSVSIGLRDSDSAAGSASERQLLAREDFSLLSPAYWRRALDALFLHNALNLLMLCLPLAIFAKKRDWDAGTVFFLSLVAIAPFAERLSYVTEQLALHTSEALGGLLNATFGNVTEIIVSFFALKGGMLRIVQVSLLGSILSNLLLVLGCAFFAGGIRHKHQYFNVHGSAVNVGLLVISVMALLFPMMLEASHEVLAPGAVMAVSRSVSCLLLLLYAGYIFFQMSTHPHLYDQPGGEGGEGGGADANGEEEEEEEAVLGVAGSILWLAIITVVIGLLSEYISPVQTRRCEEQLAAHGSRRAQVHGRRARGRGGGVGRAKPLPGRHHHPDRR